MKSGIMNNRGADPKGYYFLTEDYVRLKMMAIMVHKDAVKGFIDLK